MSTHTDALREIAANHGWSVCDDAANEIEANEQEIARLRDALLDTLDFIERHSNRWDGMNGKHPMEIVAAAREALTPN